MLKMNSLNESALHAPSSIFETDWSLPQQAQPLPHARTTHNDSRLLEIVQNYGYEHQSFLSLCEGSEVWFSAAPEAAVVYRQIKNVAIVTAAPLADREHWQAVTQAFLASLLPLNLDKVE